MAKMKQIGVAALQDLIAQAATAPRRRKNLNLHESYDDVIQRFVNAFEPGTYVRPHRHAGKWELFALLQGEAALLTFDDDGRVTDRAELNTNGGARVVEVPATTWHSLVSLAPGTVLFEVRRGPYEPSKPAEYAAWAPAENDLQASAFERSLRIAGPGTGCAQSELPGRLAD